MKIVSSGKVLNTSKLYKKKRKKKLFKLSLLLVLFFSSVWSLIYMSQEERFLIKETVISGVDVVDRDEMKSLTEGLLEGFYFWFVPRSNLAVFPRAEIKSTLLENFKRLKNVKLETSENTLIVSIEERIPAALYCPEALRNLGASSCYFIDKEALIFAKAPAFSGDSFFIYGTETTIDDPIGKVVASVEEFSALSVFFKNLEYLEIRAKALEIGDESYTLLTDENARLMWKKEYGLEKIYENLDAFLSEETIRAEKNFLERVEYLDLRVEDKVFYRFKK